MIGYVVFCYDLTVCLTTFFKFDFQLCPLIMVILRSIFDDQDVPLFNVYFYTKFAPDLQIGHRMKSSKIDSAFRFIQRSLTMLRGSDGQPVSTETDFYDLLIDCFDDLSDFIGASPLTMVYPNLENETGFSMNQFSTIFEIMLESDFDAIFRTIDLEEKSGLSSLRDRKLVPRSGEPLTSGTIMGMPADEHYADLLGRYVNAGTSDMMVISVGTAAFNNSMDRNDTDSVNTGPFPVVASPGEIVQTRR